MNTLLNSITFEFVDNNPVDPSWISITERILVSEPDYGSYFLSVLPSGCRNISPRYYNHDYGYCVLDSVFQDATRQVRNADSSMIDIDGTGDCQDMFDVRNHSVKYKRKRIGVDEDWILMSLSYNKNAFWLRTGRVESSDIITPHNMVFPHMEDGGCADMATYNDEDYCYLRFSLDISGLIDIQ